MEIKKREGMEVKQSELHDLVDNAHKVMTDIGYDLEAMEQAIFRAEELVHGDGTDDDGEKRWIVENIDLHNNFMWMVRVLREKALDRLKELEEDIGKVWDMTNPYRSEQ